MERSVPEVPEALLASRRRCILHASLCGACAAQLCGCSARATLVAYVAQPRRANAPSVPRAGNTETNLPASISSMKELKASWKKPAHGAADEDGQLKGQRITRKILIHIPRSLTSGDPAVCVRYFGTETLAGHVRRMLYPSLCGAGNIHE